MSASEETIKVADMQKEMMEEAIRISKEAIGKYSIEVDIAQHIK